jgi:hypothetical protein
MVRLQKDRKETFGDMGIRSWFRKFISKINEMLGMHDKYNDFKCTAYFDDGGVFTYQGKPWGVEFEEFKRFVSKEANVVEMNMNGGFWKF